jgi:carotenoid cleavage dioxygenase
VRWTFDPTVRSDTFSETVLDDHPGEFPRLDERFVGLPYRHGYFQASTDHTRTRDARNGLAHIDHQTGRVSTWRPGVADQCGEPVFVPRSATADEGDGLLHARQQGARPHRLLSAGVPDTISPRREVSSPPDGFNSLRS